MKSVAEYDLALFDDERGVAGGQLSWPARILRIAGQGPRENFTVLVSPGLDMFDRCPDKKLWREISRARESVFEMAALMPELTFLAWTKRPEDFTKHGPLGRTWEVDGIPKNIWLGTVLESQNQIERLWNLSRHNATLFAVLNCPPFDLSSIDWSPHEYSRGTYNALDGKGTFKDSRFMAWDEFDRTPLGYVFTPSPQEPEDFFEAI